MYSYHTGDSTPAVVGYTMFLQNTLKNYRKGSRKGGASG